MTTRLDLICHGSTSATIQAAFAQDEPLDQRGLAQASAVAAGSVKGPALGGSTLGGPVLGGSTLGGSTLRGPVMRGPALRCEQTVAALGLEASIHPGLDDWDLGRWAGQSLADVSAEHPEDVAAWLTDPTVAPHGGQSLVQLLERVGRWLDQQGDHGGRLTAVTHAAVIRAAVVHALGAPPEAFWRLDVGPLARVSLTGREGRWNLAFPMLGTGGS